MAWPYSLANMATGWKEIPVQNWWLLIIEDNAATTKVTKD